MATYIGVCSDVPGPAGTPSCSETGSSGRGTWARGTLEDMMSAGCAYCPGCPVVTAPRLCPPRWWSAGERIDPRFLILRILFTNLLRGWARIHQMIDREAMQCCYISCKQGVWTLLFCGGASTAATEDLEDFLVAGGIFFFFLLLILLFWASRGDEAADGAAGLQGGGSAGRHVGGQIHATAKIQPIQVSCRLTHNQHIHARTRWLQDSPVCTTS